MWFSIYHDEDGHAHPVYDNYYDSNDEDYGYSHGYDDPSDMYVSGIIFVRDSSDEEYAATSSKTSQEQISPRPLVDLCCRFLAVNFPFAYIENRQPPVPEDLQLRIISFAFPDSKQTIMRFAKFSGKDTTMARVRRLSSEVTKLCQIGFRLSAWVNKGIYPSEHAKTFNTSYVTVYFDRGKITKAYCTVCDDLENGCCWCDHVLAVCMARIDQKNACEIYPPLSDSFNQLSREQLLKFSQHLLYDHHLKPGIIESGQVLLSKLRKPHISQISTLGAETSDEEMTQAAEDDLNSIPGAPDLTAGAGMEDKAHWFLCKESFLKKSIFKDRSLEEMGFVFCQKSAHQEHAEWLWSKGRFIQGFLGDGLTFTPSTTNYVSTDDEMLKAVYEILQEDYVTALTAIIYWSDDVFNRCRKRKHNGLEDHSDSGFKAAKYRRNQATAYYEALRARVQHGRESQSEHRIQVEGTENQYSPRPFSWNRSYDLAKMWRVALLNPRLTKGRRDEIACMLRIGSKDYSIEIDAGKKATSSWPGFCIALSLLHFDIHRAELQALCQGKVDVLPEVCVSSDEDRKRSNMQISLCEIVEDCMKSMNAKAGDNQTDATVSQVKTEVKPQQMAEDNLEAVAASFVFSDLNENSAKTDDLQLIPRWLKCGGLLCDINTYIAVAEALEIYGQDVHATFLSCAVSFALLKFYHSCVGNKFQSSASEKQSNQTLSDEEIDAFTCFPPLCLPNVALLYSLISGKSDIVETWLQNLNKALNSDSGETSVQESILSPVSFVFQVGVMGLLVARSPSALPDLEGNIFHHEKWLVHQLMESSPLDTDLKFLSQCLSAMLNIPSQITISISLAHLLFHHLFKESFRVESFDTLTTAQKSVMENAISIFGSSISHTKSFANKCFFLGVMWRKAASFAREVLYVTSTCSSLHERVIETLVQSSGLFGDPSLSRPALPSSDTDGDLAIDLAVFYNKRCIYDLVVSLILSFDNVEEQELGTPEIKERTKVLQKSKMLLLIRLLFSSEQLKPTISALMFEPRTTKISRRQIISDLITVFKAGNIEENFQILQDHPSYSVDTFTIDEVLQICEKLLERNRVKNFKPRILSPVPKPLAVFIWRKMEILICQEDPMSRLPSEHREQSRNVAQSVLTKYVKHKVAVNDDSKLLDVINWFSRYCSRTMEKDKRKHLLPAVCEQLLSMSSSSSVAAEIFCKAAKKLSLEVAPEHKRQSGATADEMTAEEEDSRLHETVVNLCISFLHCVKNWCQYETDLSNKQETVAQYLNDVCSSLRDVVETRSVPNRKHYVDKFLTVAMTTIERPKWMFQIVEKIAPLFKVAEEASVRSWDYEQKSEFREACNQSFQLKELLERCRKAFEDVLRGPEVNQKLQQVSQEEPFNGKAGPYEKTRKEKQALRKVKLSDGLTLTNCLELTKRAHLGLCDAETSSFRSLFKELEGRHPVLSVIARGYVEA